MGDRDGCTVFEFLNTENEMVEKIITAKILKKNSSLPYLVDGFFFVYRMGRSPPGLPSLAHNTVGSPPR
jgi:hypothetical protein